MLRTPSYSIMNRGKKRRRRAESEDSEEGTHASRCYPISMRKKTVGSDEVEADFSLENLLLRSQIQGLQADMLNIQTELADTKAQLVQRSELIEELQDQVDLLEHRVIECSGEAGLLQNQISALNCLTREMELTRSEQVLNTPAQSPDVLVQSTQSADNDNLVSASPNCPTIEYHANLVNRYHALCPPPPQWFSRAF
ncbi:hypothetical protein BDP27DRAFT_1375605, partial [Rhodocollybia butyracea]